jgi:hypothetical protein
MDISDCYSLVSGIGIRIVCQTPSTNISMHNPNMEGTKDE